MKIKNFDELNASPIRKMALAIAEAGLSAIDTATVLETNLRLEGEALWIKDQQFSLEGIRKLIIIGVGKCALEAGAALEKILGDKITGGIVVDVHEGKLSKIETYTGTHPLPTEQNLDATKKIIELLSGLTDKDLVLCVISGGGSTLLCQPGNFTCQEEALLFTCLTKAGADIQKINTVRKHVSLARGGYLAKYAYPAKVVSLIFSDVPGSDLEFIASGPTVKDTTTIEDARRILKEFQIKEACGFSEDALIETPKEGHFFKNVHNILFLSNQTALEAMAEKARELGLRPEIKTAELHGEARDVGSQIIRDIDKAPPLSVLLYGGETTVTVRVKGKGGRNQELVLSAVPLIKEGRLIAAIASDGRDNTDFGGALCDIITTKKAEKLGLNPELLLNQNNSYNFFASVGDYLITGDTGSNVSDLILAIKSEN